MRKVSINKIKKFLEIIKKLRYILTEEQQKKSIYVFLCIIVSSVLELLSVTAILPFIYVMLEPSKLLENKYVILIFDALHIKMPNGNAMVYYIGGGIIFVFCLRSFVLIWANYVRLKFENNIMKTVSDLMMGSYMRRPYEEIADMNSAEALRGINVSATSVYYTLQGFFLLIANLLNVILVMLFLFCVDYAMALGLILVGGGFLVCMLAFTQRIVRKSGANFNASMLYMNQYMAESFDGLKEISVLRRKQYFIDKFEIVTETKNVAELKFRFLQYYPNVVIQTMFICMVILFACLRLNWGMSPDVIIPTLASFAYGAIKIIPGVSSISSYVSSILYYYDSFNDAYQNIYLARNYYEKKKEIIEETKNSGNEEAVHFSCLLIDGLTWRYKGTDVDVLKDVNLEIHKGECIGLVGKSGAGKSTLADIILGILDPKIKGVVSADGVDIFTVPEKWAHTVGYVPQKVFLMDDSIKNNVLFGAADDEGNEEKIWYALEQAQLKDYVVNLPDKLETKIGEGGAKLSGGQRQRIAIARALFNDPELLVLDEATSALDNETERAVMESIDYLQGRKTMIIIAHRLSTIENCDKVYEIKDGKAILQHG